MAKFILADENMEANSDGADPTNFAGKNLGKCVFVKGEDMTEVDINPSGWAGEASTWIYLCLQLARKDKWVAKKSSESYFCPSSFTLYYHYTQEQKEKLEKKIRDGLDNIKNDVDEFNKIDDKVSKYNAQIQNLNDLDSGNASKQQQAEFYFKHMFIDEIDYFAGSRNKDEEGKASLMGFQKNSFPTIIDDFLKLNNLNQLQTDDYFKNIPEVEKNLLKSKLNAYNEWMKIFSSTIKSRAEQYAQIKRSKEFIINQTKQSLKPYIFQYKRLEETLSQESERKRIRSLHREHIAGVDVFLHYTVHYLFKSLNDIDPVQYPKQYVTEGEIEGHYGKYGCYDEFMKKELIFNFDHGLIADFPWITEEWIEEKINEIITDKGAFGIFWNKNRLYYTFHKIDTEVKLAQSPFGHGNLGWEDTDFVHTMFLMSRNIFAAKLLELKAKEEENERYINQMIGIVPKLKGRPVVKYEKQGSKYIANENIYESKAKMLEAFKSDKFNLMEIKKPNELIEEIKDILNINFSISTSNGPYENQFFKVITKIFLKTVVKDRYTFITNLYLEKMNIEGKLVEPPKEGTKLYQFRMDGL